MNKLPTTILIIEDEEILRQSVVDYLEDRDFRVLGAENGKVGLEILEKENPDLILTDLRMPEVDGLEVMKRVSESALDTPVIVVSGTGNIGDAIRALRLGAWDYILKPIEDMTIISHAVGKVLERARLIRENREYQLNLEQKVVERTLELESANEQLRGINERLRKVVETTRSLSICQEVSVFGFKLLEEFAMHMQATGGSIYIAEEAGLRRLHSLNSNHAPQFIPFPLAQDSVLQWTIENRRSLLIQDIAKDQRMKPSGWDGYSNGSLLAFPLLNEEGGIAGVITLHCKNAPPFVEQDKEIGAILASHSCETLRAVRAVDRLRESETRFRELVELLPEAILEMDLNFCPTFVNNKVFDLFGFTPEDIVSELNGFNMIIPKDRKRAAVNFSRRLRGEKFGMQEYTGLRKDGSTFPMLLHASPVQRNGEIVGSRGIVIDITERKQAEQQLQQTQKMESIGTLAGGIAHDFNNILSAIFGYTQLARMASGDFEKQDKALDGVIQAAERAKSLVKQILTFSRKGGEEKRPLTLATLGKEVLKLIRQTIPTTITIASDIFNTRAILADPTQMHQVLMNLCTNAYHAMRKAGGTLRVSILDRTLNSQETKGDVVVPPGEYVLIEVSDTGVGMDGDVLQKIFEPYYTTKDVGEGTGLGLSVVHGIVANHHGYIFVESELGIGTTFQIYIPAVESRPEEEAGGENVTPGSPQSSGRVLFVDDEEALVDIARKAFPKYGYSIAAFRDPGEALKEFLLEPERYDLAITDMTMPTMTGIELTRALLAIRPDLPVFLCTGYSELITREDAEKQGVSTFIEKPYTTVELIEIINKHFRRNQS